MAAWDSVVGHHMGLSRSHRTFTKSFSKTSDEEVHELYRNGIVHGMLTNYDNVIVATKAWNRLFAVADWAKAREEQAKEPEPEPTWGELFQGIRRNKENREALEAFEARTLMEGDSGLEENLVYQRASRYLESWKAKNYGAMGEMLASISRRDASAGAVAGQVRELYSLVELDEFRIRGLDHRAAAACEVDVVLTCEGEPKPGRMRWIREKADGDPALPTDDGEWRLVSYGPWAMFNAGEASDSGEAA